MPEFPKMPWGARLADPLKVCGGLVMTPSELAQLTGRKSNHGERHGGKGTRLYTIWTGIKRRCLRPRCKSYEFYGGRGISVCDEWIESFIQFRHWAIQNGYGPELTIDRIDTNGNYCPSNCRWVSTKENSRNTRRCQMLTAFGESKCLTEWAEDCRCVVGYRALLHRVQLGWEGTKALTHPRIAPGDSCRASRQSTCGHRGVWFDRSNGKWRAHSSARGGTKQRSLGSYDSMDAAVKAREADDERMRALILIYEREKEKE